MRGSDLVIQDRRESDQRLLFELAPCVRRTDVQEQFHRCAGACAELGYLGAEVRDRHAGFSVRSLAASSGSREVDVAEADIATRDRVAQRLHLIHLKVVNAIRVTFGMEVTPLRTTHGRDALAKVACDVPAGHGSEDTSCDARGHVLPGQDAYSGRAVTPTSQCQPSLAGATGEIRRASTATFPQLERAQH